jgi:hypothetical protein
MAASDAARHFWRRCETDDFQHSAFKMKDAVAHAQVPKSRFRSVKAFQRQKSITGHKSYSVLRLGSRSIAPSVLLSDTRFLLFGYYLQVSALSHIRSMMKEP